MQSRIQIILFFFPFIRAVERNGRDWEQMKIAILSAPLPIAAVTHQHGDVHPHH
jgi:hypothetical protein